MIKKQDNLNTMQGVSKNYTSKHHYEEGDTTLFETPL